MYTKKKKLKLTPRFVCCSVGQLAVLVSIENINWKGEGMDNPDSATKISYSFLWTFPHDSFFSQV